MAVNVNHFIFNDINSRDCGLYISKRQRVTPERDIEAIEIPGMNGAALLDYATFKNTTVTYEGFIVDDVAENIIKLKDMLYSAMPSTPDFDLFRGASCYRKLRDSYDADGYMLAYLAQAPEIEVLPYNSAATVKIVFNVRPEIFLDSGMDGVTLAAGSSVTIENPTQYIAAPAFSLYGAGTIKISKGGNGFSGGYGILVETTLSYEPSVMMDTYTGWVNTDHNTPVTWAKLSTYSPYDLSSTLAIPRLIGNYRREIRFSCTGDIHGTMYPRWWRI